MVLSVLLMDCALLRARYLSMLISLTLLFPMPKIVGTRVWACQHSPPNKSSDGQFLLLMAWTQDQSGFAERAVVDELAVLVAPDGPQNLQDRVGDHLGRRLARPGLWLDQLQLPVRPGHGSTPSRIRTCVHRLKRKALNQTELPGHEPNRDSQKFSNGPGRH